MLQANVQANQKIDAYMKQKAQQKSLQKVKVMLDSASSSEQMQGQGVQMKLQSAILQALEADQKQAISSSLSSQQQTELVNKMKQKWGFLQNIINIDKFFSSKKDAKHTDKFESFASLKKKYDRVERDFLKDSADDKKNTDISLNRNAKKPVGIKSADEADSGAKEDGDEAKAKKEEPKEEEPKKNVDDLPFWAHSDSPGEEKKNLVEEDYLDDFIEEDVEDVKQKNLWENLDEFLQDELGDVDFSSVQKKTSDKTTRARASSIEEEDEFGEERATDNMKAKQQVFYEVLEGANLTANQELRRQRKEKVFMTEEEEKAWLDRYNHLGGL